MPPLKIPATREHLADVTRGPCPERADHALSERDEHRGTRSILRGRERGVVFSGTRAHSPRAAVAVRRSRSASRANLGFFSRLGRYRHRKRGVGSPARPLVARADDVPRLERHSHTTRLAVGSFGRAPRRARLRDRGAANARPDRLGSDREQRVDRPIDADAACEARKMFFFKEFFADDNPRVHQTPT